MFSSPIEAKDNSSDLVEQYTIEFLDNHEDHMSIRNQIVILYNNTLRGKRNLEAISPKDLDYFYILIKRLLENDRERSYLELKLRYLSDRDLSEKFFDKKSTQKLTLIWAATEIIGFDIYQNIFEKIYGIKKLRRMILSNTNDVGLRESKVKQLIKKYQNVKKKKRLKSFLKIFTDKRDSIESALQDDFELFTFEVIDKLKKKIKIKVESNFNRNLGNFIFYFRDIGDTFNIRFNNIFSDVSGDFGNIAGKIKWRNGRLHENKIVFDKVSANLKPLDIIVEKTPFILTDYLIPGHFGHIALYLGSESELKELGIWESSFIKPFQEEISRGNKILEATRQGVRISKLIDFINVDEIAILRMNKGFNEFSKEQINEMYRRALNQVGKAYDFNFDVESSDEIVCSELIYQSFYFVDWQIERVLGRWTISPDNIVQSIFQEKPKLDLILYIKGYMGGNFKNLSETYLRKKLDILH